MDIAKALGLFIATALAEIVGCYLPWLWLRQGASAWWLVPAAASLALFAWLLTLHPKCAPELFDRYRGLVGPNAAFVETEQLMAAQRAADVLVADTTSVVSEFVVQHKPVVTLRNRAPKPHMLDFDEPARLPAMLDRAFAPTPELRAAIVAYADAIHPYRDGLSSERVLVATEDLIAGRLGRLRGKPLGGRFRALQIRSKLGWWGLG